MAVVVEPIGSLVIPQSFVLGRGRERVGADVRRGNVLQQILRGRGPCRHRDHAIGQNALRWSSRIRACSRVHRGKPSSQVSVISRFAQYWPFTVPESANLPDRTDCRTGPAIEGTGIWPVSTPWVNRVP